MEEPDHDGPAKSRSDLFEFVSPEDFADADLPAFLLENASADEHALQSALWSADATAQQAGDNRRSRVFRLLAQLMSMRMRVGDQGDVFGPMLMMGDRRSMVAADVRGEQNDVLATLAADIAHPVLRARIGDVAFLNSRAHHRAGRTAMEAYCEIVDGRLDDKLNRDFPEIRLGVHDVVDPLVRATQLMRLLVKRGEIDSAVRRAFDRVVAAARDTSGYVAFVAAAEAGMQVGLVDFDVIADQAERLAATAPAGAYPEAVKRAWLLAARCHALRERPDDANRCQIEAAGQTLRMREQCHGALARAHWTKLALAELRSLKGTTDRVAELRRELRDLQDAGRDEAVAVEIPMDLQSERDKAVELFGRIGLPEAFRQLIGIVQPPDVADLRKIAVDMAKESFVATMFGSTWLDGAGKEVARVAAPDAEGGPDESWIKAECIRHMSIVRHQQVSGLLEPGRRALMRRFSVDERHVTPITHASPFSPPGHANILALGFARMFQGDYVSAAHILFPQLENSLRHMLVLAGSDPAKIESDLLEGDRTLTALLDLNRDDLERMWGRNVVSEIDLLFNFKPGPALRNELAHGKLTWNAFHAPETIVGCWFIFNLACRTVMRDWEKRVAPAIEAEL